MRVSSMNKENNEQEKKMNKKEYEKRIEDRLLRVTIQRLEDEIQLRFDLIGDLQRGKIDVEDIPECFKESEERYWIIKWIFFGKMMTSQIFLDG